MTNDKIHQIVARKNEQLEREASDRAAHIIDEIGECHKSKAHAERRILELREELKKLEVTQLDPVSILGGAS